MRSAERRHADALLQGQGLAREGAEPARAGLAAGLININKYIISMTIYSKYDYS